MNFKLKTRLKGNITRANATIWSNNLGTQSGRQASASPPGEGNNTTQINSQGGAPLPSREASSLSQAITPVSNQVSVVLPNSTFAMAHLPLGKGSSSSQAIAHRPSREGGIPPRPLLSFLPVKVAVPPRQLLTFLLRKEALSPRPLLSFPSSEGNSIPQATNSPPGRANQ